MNGNQRPLRGCQEQKEYAVYKATLLENIGLSEVEFEENYHDTFHLLVTPDPTIGVQIINSRLWVYQTRNLPRFPSVTFGYSFDDGQVYLHFVQLNEGGDD